MTLVGIACETFTGVMLPLEHDCHTSRGNRTRTVPFDPLPPLLLPNRRYRLATKTGEFSHISLGFLQFGAVPGYGNLTNI